VKSRSFSRRCLLGTAAVAATATIVQRHVLGSSERKPPSEKLNIAGVGVGGQGRGDLQQLAGENIVALCDVDWSYAARTFDKYPKARKYKDFREMLEKEKSIDAVVIATPDHTHAVAAMTAIKMGKHVYCEKPLTRPSTRLGIGQGGQRATRWPRRWATRHGLRGQPADQRVARGRGDRPGCARCTSGPTGRRTAASFPLVGTGIERPEDEPPVPDSLELGPVAGPGPQRPYHPAYAPSAGAAGGISGPAAWATWASTTSRRCSPPSSSARRPASKPVRRPSMRRRFPRFVRALRVPRPRRDAAGQAPLYDGAWWPARRRSWRTGGHSTARMASCSSATRARCW